ncbi:MerR family redox-sensitive transcriptional activator SoxR [Actinomadura pelletieri DSM 43383]|uniref:MerR family redox-sensitive transcriptional activator SoxR n=1 Tax=Actinomadura pelletieri DSM 43383 TaxID=1120940 RepID=A0A495QYB4_9ACTN|nr:MerR family transcriptional regulator [Actinomadura pelletieri]RKS79048.1 MerR family redox-sensitive transcriptional activator SoxR [Actinomadura pelletieri DSM 43383]
MTGSATVQPQLTVGELARASGVAPSAVRFYEAHGLLTSERTAGNQRRFREPDVCRTKVIRVAQRVGLSIAEIKAIFAELPPEPALADWEHLTRSLITEAEQRIRQLRRVLEDIASGEKLCELPSDRTT